jgi:hypothetical protein
MHNSIVVEQHAVALMLIDSRHDQILSPSIDPAQATMKAG